MFDRTLGHRVPVSTTDRSRALIDRIRSSARAEAQQAAGRLDAIAELFEMRRVEIGEHAHWVADTWASVGAEVAAALRISLAMAGSYLHYARAMEGQLPKVAAVFRAGDIDYRMFQTVVFRTGLIENPVVLAEVDAQLAARVARWPSMTQGRLAGAIDQIVAAKDPDAVRRVRKDKNDREIRISDAPNGMADVVGTMFAPEARALDKRLDALADTVCDADPRTKAQRRADALGSLAAGADRLGCRCGTGDCTAGKPPASPVVIHVLAEQPTIDGRSHKPGSMLDADGLIPAAIVAELAATAKLVPLAPPTQAEPRYTPSAKLAAFVRARDLTCRAPGCDQPATQCDVDHTTPHADGGLTHPSNNKLLCRTHHLLKTFFGWRDIQLPDGTVVWHLPGGQTYVTTPGSALLFPSLSAPTGDLPPATALKKQQCDKTVMMPMRTRTRSENRAHYIAEERRQNQRARQKAEAPPGPCNAVRAPDPNDEPPPF